MGFGRNGHLRSCHLEQILPTTLLFSSLKSPVSKFRMCNCHSLNRVCQILHCNFRVRSIHNFRLWTKIHLAITATTDCVWGHFFKFIFIHLFFVKAIQYNVAGKSLFPLPKLMRDLFDEPANFVPKFGVLLSSKIVLVNLFTTAQSGFDSVTPSNLGMPM